MIVLDDSRLNLEQLWSSVEYVGISRQSLRAGETDPRLHLPGLKVRHARRPRPKVKRWR